MTFNTQKWLLFFIILCTGSLLAFVAHKLVFDKETYYSYVFSEPLTTKQNSIIFITKPKQLLKTKQDLESRIQNYYHIFSANFFFDEWNTISSDQTIFINQTEYNFLQELKEYTQSYKETQANKKSIFSSKQECQSPNTSSEFCNIYFNDAIIINESIINDKKSYTMKKTMPLIINTDQQNFLIDIYILKKIREYLKQQGIAHFVIKIGNFILSQERDTKKGWGIYFSKSSSSLYYLYNQIAYITPGTKNISEAIVIDLPVTDIEIPFLEIWQKTLEKKYPEKQPQLEEVVSVPTIKKPIVQKTVIITEEKTEEKD